MDGDAFKLGRYYESELNSLRTIYGWMETTPNPLGREGIRQTHGARIHDLGNSLMGIAYGEAQFVVPDEERREISELLTACKSEDGYQKYQKRLQIVRANHGKE